MERIAPLSTGTKLTIAAGGLLFTDLFLTWQQLPLKFGKKFEVTKSLDGWDRLGLIIGLLTLMLLAIVVLRSTDVELSPEVPWNQITLALASLIFAVALVKSATDDHRAWASFAGVVLAAGTVVGAYLDRSRQEPISERPVRAKWRPRVRASAVPPSNGASPRAALPEPEAQAVEPSRRW